MTCIGEAEAGRVPTCNLRSSSHQQSPAKAGGSVSCSGNMVHCSTQNGAGAGVALGHWNSHIGGHQDGDLLGCQAGGILQWCKVCYLWYRGRHPVADLDVGWVILWFKILIVQILPILVPVEICTC